jgi:hypothetical protein
MPSVVQSLHGFDTLERSIGLGPGSLAITFAEVGLQVCWLIFCGSVLKPNRFYIIDRFECQSMLEFISTHK